MPRITLDQIEADFVVVLVNRIVGRAEVHPFWECGLNEDHYWNMVASMAHRFAEDCGMGHVEVHIQDYR